MKDKVTITIDKDLVEWMDVRIMKRKFANRSHCFEYLISEQMNTS